LTIAVIVRGSLSHRGTSLESIIDDYQKMRQIAPETFFGLVTSSTLNPVSLAALSGTFDLIVTSKYKVDSALSPGMNSIIRQAKQVEELIAQVPDDIGHVLLLRTDFRILSPEVLWTKTTTHFSKFEGIGVLNFNCARLPIMPMPYHISDLLCLGTLSTLQRLWGGVSKWDTSKEQIPRWNSRRLLSYIGQSKYSAEQMLWRAYFMGSPYPPGASRLRGREIETAWKQTQTLSHYSPFELGLLGPSEFFTRSRIAGLFFGLSKPPKSIFFIKSLSQISAVIGNYLFIFHPHWLVPRIRGRKNDLENQGLTIRQ